jgi:uncharacterized NAD(P)/FAD-binding protein YdhS
MLEVQHAGGAVTADHVVLALGHAGHSHPLRNLRWPVCYPQYIADPWEQNALVGLDASVPTLLLGTGLTMVDTALAIRARRPHAQLIAVSRRGLLPRRHPTVVVAAAPPLPPDIPCPSSAPALMRWVRQLIDASGDDWPAAVDSLRPITDRLWHGLTSEDQARFLRHAHRHWEVHRHRMAPVVGDEIDGLLAEGSLSIVAGRLVQARSERRRRVQVEIRHRSGEIESVMVGAVINCTGPAMSLERSNDPLVSGLLGRGMARPGPHGLGLDVDETGAVRDSIGRPQRGLSALGPLCRGVRWETTAVPEIRAQAQALAARLAFEFGRVEPHMVGGAQWRS